jgi:Tyrosine phosphatase family
MLIPMGFTQRVVFGGPYYDKPFGYVGVKLAPEVLADAMIELPIGDYSVPRDLYRTNATVWMVLNFLAEKDAVFVGCMGGRGRTGLFLALLAKSMGVPNPILYVRTHYLPKAIETKDQERYVSEYEPPFSRWDLTWLKLRALRAGRGPTGLGLRPMV